MPIPQGVLSEIVYQLIVGALRVALFLFASPWFFAAMAFAAIVIYAEYG